MDSNSLDKALYESASLSKSNSLWWILFMYLLAAGSGLLWLLLGPKSSSVIVDSLIADLWATLIIFSFSRYFKNSSCYDAYWSVIPPLFLCFWWVTAPAVEHSGRILLLSLVVWYWAIRLTANWISYWPGMVHEDWRYIMLRDQHPNAKFWVDFGMIHLFPTLQVFLGMLPMYAVTRWTGNGLYWLDYAAFAVGIGAVTLQLISDRQLHRFTHRNTTHKIIDTGLWAYSRHPNYFGELMFWCSLALFGLAAAPQEWWWQILGALAMLGMFLGASIPMMEKRSLERRPGYAQVQQRVSLFLPWPPKKS